MNELYPGLPPELENDWVDAIAAGEVSTALAQFLDANPAARAELEALDEVAVALRRDRDDAHPGAHFFESLSDDIMASLPTPSDGPAPLLGRKVGAGTRASSSWWSAAWSWFGKRPTLAWAAVMAVALVVILAWPRTVDSPAGGIAETAPDVGEAVVPDDDVDEVAVAARENWLAAALPHGLSRDEVHELRQLASEIEISGLDADDNSDDLDDDWGFGVGAGAVEQMGNAELDSALNALEAPR